MQIMIFKTDVNSKRDITRLSAMMHKIAGVRRWNVDLEDIDRVLRIEVSSDISEYEIMGQALCHGINCAPLAD